jgi:hypothetical protein
MTATAPLLQAWIAWRSAMGRSVSSIIICFAIVGVERRMRVCLDADGIDAAVLPRARVRRARAA